MKGSWVEKLREFGEGGQRDSWHPAEEVLAGPGSNALPPTGSSH